MPTSASRASRAARRVLATAACALALTLAGCSAAMPPPMASTPARTPTPVRTAFTAEPIDSTVYAVQGGRTLEADVCLPQRDDPAPPLVLVHGGAFVEGGRADFDPECTAGAEHGFATFSIDYRLLPDPYPAALDDLEAALAWVREPEQVRRYRLSSSPIRLVGSSAGATLAAQALAGLGDDPKAAAPVDRAVLLSGLYDLRPAEVPPSLVSDFARYSGGRAAAISPQDRVASIRASLLVVSGNEQELVPKRHADAFAYAARSAGVPVQRIVDPDPDHAIQIPRRHPAIAAAMWAFLTDG